MGTKEIMRVFRNEFDVISSDKKTLAIFLLGPIIIMMAFGGATIQRSELFTINVAVVDEDQSSLSNSLVTKFEQSNYMVVKYKTDRSTAEQLFREGQIDGIVLVHQGFDSKVRTFYLYGSESEKARLDLIVDSSYFIAPVAAPLALQSVLVDFYMKDIPRILNLPTGEISPETIKQLVTRLEVLYVNVDLAYGEVPKDLSFFSIIFPLMTPIVLFVFGIFMCGLSIVGERVRGTLPRVLKTPIRRSEIVLGKLLVYLIIALWDSGIVLLLGTLIFRLPVKGGFLPLLVALYLTTFTGCTWGMFYSTFAKSERQVADLQTYTMVLVMVLGGVIFPISVMPDNVQVLAKVLPISHSLNAIRAITIKGLGPEIYGGDIGYLLLFGLIMLGLALISFRLIKE